MNIPAISERTLRRDIVASGVTTASEIQVSTASHDIKCHYV